MGCRRHTRNSFGKTAFVQKRSWAKELGQKNLGKRTWAKELGQKNLGKNR
jgi:hypothetical protein